MDEIRSADPSMPASLNDRAADNWRSLLAIADIAGGDWPDCARKAAEVLSGNATEDETDSTLLLGDIRHIFHEKGVDRIATKDLVAQLVAMEDKPWSTWKYGVQITKYQIAKLLKPFGITTKPLRTGNKVFQGYALNNFEDTFARYLPAQSVTGVTVFTNKDLDGN